ncbi:FkbM family methyltransferase [Arcobacter sp. CECT 8985]|uniref:FkbM family methyltransferase n=1 Tax=Arcobacter sp. CECT 8985 TaxID=1935424 RepID=UPI00100AFDDA|nr:FkbM family methyltransferase [Arcobacter sp. CECT 8985]RXJ85290.1 hypothetical protein CRU93_11400 [Arcobacter sp. CECT 8985]
MNKKPEDQFKSNHYQRHNEARFNHLESLSIDFNDKTVLELGAGIGDHTEFLLSLGVKNITSLEGRKENFDILQERFKSNEKVKPLLYNLDLDSHNNLNEKFDIVYCYGLLYHISKPKELIEFLAEHTKEILLLETCVSYESNNASNIVEEDKESFSQSVTGYGCRPARNWLFDELKKNYEYVYMPITQPDHEEFPKDWTKKVYTKGNLTRAVFVASKKELKNSLLKNNVLMFQKEIYEILDNKDEPFRRYYSQHGEDYLLWKFFDFKKDGFFVEVGAFDGVHLSNTYSFELEGWNGICVEPGQYFENCKKNRPNSICINAACVGSEDIKEITFYEEELGLLSSLDISTEKKEDIEKRYENRKLEFLGHKEKTVKAKTLNSILEENDVSEIDFITIDVEGAEIDVLKGFNLHKYKPKVVILEANDEEHKKELIDYMTIDNNYLFSRNIDFNLIFVLYEYDSFKIGKIKINCSIEKQLHPLGLKYTLPDYLSGLQYYNGENIIYTLWDRFISLEKKNQEIEEKEKIIKKKNQEIEEKEKIIKKKNQSLAYFKPLEKYLEKIVNISIKIHPLEKYKEYKNLLNSYHKLKENENRHNNFLTLPTDDFFSARNKKYYISELDEPILIYQVGKVGSSTIYESLKDKVKDVPIYQIHNIETADEILKKEKQKGFMEGLHHLTIGSELNQIIKNNPQIHWKLIVGIREPIHRWLSDIFQNINERYNYFVKEDGDLKYDKLIDFVKESLETEPMQDWFINELEKTFKIKLSEINFNKNKGYFIYKKNGMEILFYQLECLKSDFNNMFKDFLPDYNISLQNANESTDKKYYIQYKKLQELLTFDEDYLREFYYKKSVTRFFYTDLQIENFINKWKGK